MPPSWMRASRKETLNKMETAALDVASQRPSLLVRAAITQTTRLTRDVRDEAHQRTQRLRVLVSMCLLMHTSVPNRPRLPTCVSGRGEDNEV